MFLTEFRKVFIRNVFNSTTQVILYPNCSGF